MKHITVIVPSLNPDEKLLGVVEGLLAVGFSDILLVNDGSKPECVHFFDQCAAHEEVTLLTHEVNCGKGAALKTAIAYVKANRPDSRGVVTVDGDGQHCADDTKAVAQVLIEKKDHLILGVRDFSLPDVPPRSRFGNRLTSFVFLGVGLKIQDTQTGLRGIPSSHYDVFLQTSGDRYEYETNMLLDLKKHAIPFDQVTIKTVYIDENQTSHFHPIRDSIRIYSQILKFCAGSVASTLVDYLAFVLVSLIAAPLFVGKDSLLILTATVTARVVSSLVNFTWNRKVAFGANGSLGGALVRYYALAIVQMLASAGLVSGINLLFGGKGLVLVTFFKILVDTALFFASYQIQKKWVFRQH